MRLGLIGRLSGAVLVAISCESAFAQTLPLEGRVSDLLGGAINGALVTIVNGESTARTARTGVDGTFAFDAITAATVTLRFEAPGFETATTTVAVTATMTPMAVVLQIAGVTESVGIVAPKLEEDLPQ